MFDAKTPLKQNAAGETGGSGFVVNDTSTSNGKDSARPSSWYTAMAQAWGDVLNNQADTIIKISDSISQGQDNPSTMILLSTESQRMSIMASNAATSVNSVGDAVETVAKKQ